ncbi:MAG: hypothetical protein EOP56_04555 [Sphingobacteriales bacterium]|nr:MAG: hypothetical protein EOP56_04555 [Sphingobacteriales bacterium]
MYQFSKIKNDDGSWRFELDGISMIVDGFTESKGQHYITNPEKAIAFFNFNGNLYGIANQIRTFNTAEEFYDQMCNQYSFFRPKTETLPSIPGRGQADSSQTSLRA